MVADEDSETEHQIRALLAKFRFVLSIRARYFFEFLVFHWIDGFAWMFRRWKVWTRDTRTLRANLAQVHLNLRQLQWEKKGSIISRSNAVGGNRTRIPDQRTESKDRRYHRRKSA